LTSTPLTGVAAGEHECQIVNVGEVVPVGQLPVRRLIFEVEVEALRSIHMVRRKGDVRAELPELERVGDVEIIAERGLLGVAREDRIMGVEAHPLERLVRAPRGDHLVERYLGG